MRIEENFSLKPYNTFHLPVMTRWFMEYGSEDELQKILRDEYFLESRSIHIGGGSNLLFLNDFNGIVLHSQIKGMEIAEEDSESLSLRVGAAEVWDDVVAYAASNGWGGIENLSGIPGETGAAAIQNIGAYGKEIAEAVAGVEAYNQLTFEKRTFTCAECEYAYRYSYFKNEHNDPYIVTHVLLRLQKAPRDFCLDYGKLRQELESKTPSPASVREAVIRIRSLKLPNPETTGNAGSFFMNPVVSAVDFEKIRENNPEIPSFPAPDGKVKIPAGWLIEQCGFKGKRYGSVGIYEKQALVLVSFDGATGNEIAVLAESIRNAVRSRFGIELVPEVKYVG
jgi:UDP-N-acetylmuramate dehydrogenase